MIARPMLLGALLALMTTAPQAREVGRLVPQIGVEVRLFDERGACPHENLVRIELHVEGKKVNDGCAFDDGYMVYIKWDDGDTGNVPRKMFAPGRGL